MLVRKVAAHFLERLGSGNQSDKNPGTFCKVNITRPLPHIWNKLKCFVSKTLYTKLIARKMCQSPLILSLTR
jgi:hypothetical protein